MIRKDEFREDLFYRLSVVTVELPPLREARRGHTSLDRSFFGHLCRGESIRRPKLSKEAFDILKEYSWPGNIRELRNFCENLVVLKRGDEITPYDLDPRFTMQESGQDTPEQATAHTLSVEENEKGFSEMPWSEPTGIARRLPN